MAKVEYKYPENAIEMAREYVDSCGQEQMELPTIEGLAIKFDVDDDTLNEWGKKHADFGQVLKRLKMYQKVQLINGGMYGGKEVNAAMFIFLLKANHGLKESSALDVTSGGKPIPIMGGTSNVYRDTSVQEDKPTDEKS